MSKWKNLFKKLAPFILTEINPKLAPVGDAIVKGMEEAEEIHKKGSDKLAHVQALGKIAANSINEITGEQTVNVETLDKDIDHVASTIIDVINLVHKKSVPTE